MAYKIILKGREMVLAGRKSVSLEIFKTARVHIAEKCKCLAPLKVRLLLFRCQHIELSAYFYVL